MKKIILAALTVALAACAGRGGKAPAQLPHGGFSFPQVPAMITAPAERNGYVALHYWDGFDFSDTVFMHSKEFRDGIFPNYANFLSSAERNKTAEAIKVFFEKIERCDTAMWNLFAEGLNTYFYDPNSPVRNDEIYIPILKQLLASSRISPEDRVRYEDRLAMAQRNRVGEPANDFTYTMANGNRGRMYDLKSEWLIIFFNNPGCHACAEIMDGFSKSPDITRMINAGRLKVLSVYPDEDIKAWREYFSHYPVKWINAYDKTQTLRNDELYDLKAIPALYLLDRDKKVVVKDASDVGTIIRAFEIAQSPS